MGAKGKSLFCRVIGDRGIVRVWENGGDHLSSHLSDISDQSSVIVVMGQGEGEGGSEVMWCFKALSMK